MITWMQKHRKYLVVTLWISTIAFVGAGFVGWGQYNYGAKSSNVAIVGDIEITGGELQDTYSNIYGYYNQLFQGKFDQEMAQKFNVEQQALTTLINQALLLNLASYYDLQTTDEEVLQELIKIPAFQKDGYFNKEIYEQVLMNARTTKKAFEAKMQKELTVQKLQPLLNSELTNYERSVAKTMLAIADKIEYKVLSLDDMSVALNKETIKAFWETRKESYQTDKQYKVELLTHPITSKTLDDATLITYYDAKKYEFKDDQGKIKTFEAAKTDVERAVNVQNSKKDALRAYIDYKKGASENANTSVHTIATLNLLLPADVMQEVETMQPNSVLKPKRVGDAFVSVKLLKVIKPRTKTFDEAFSEVRMEFEQDGKQKALLAQAQAELPTFSGEKTDFITKDDHEALTALKPAEAKEFLEKLFVNSSQEGTISIRNKTILYRILEQKLLHLDNTRSDTLSTLETTLARVKQEMITQNIFRELEKTYPTELFYKGN